MSTGDTRSDRHDRSAAPLPVSDASDRPPAFTVYLALGANLGRRRAQLSAALDALHDHPDVTVSAVSDLYETTPVGTPPDHPRYLNAAARIQTTLPPGDLLRVTQSVERRLGRRRPAPGPVRDAGAASAGTPFVPSMPYPGTPRQQCTAPAPSATYRPRTIDIDILLYDPPLGFAESPGRSPVATDPLLPHPRMHRRAFVLRPLADIAPSLVHPHLNRTIADLLADCPDAADPRCRRGPRWWRPGNG